MYLYLKQLRSIAKNRIGYRLVYCCFSLLFCACSLQAQNTATSDRKVGHQLFKDKNYSAAIVYLAAAYEAQPENTELQLQLAIAYYHTNEPARATVHINSLLENQRRIAPKTYLYKAYLLHNKSEFKTAIQFYKQYLRHNKIPQAERRQVKKYILNCANGLQLQYRTQNNSIKNLGQSINSSMDESFPIPSPNYDDLVYFSSNRLGSWDVFGATFSKDGVTSEELFPLEINSNEEEQLIDFNKAGTAMRFLRSKTQAARILVDTFRQEGKGAVMEFTEVTTPFQQADSTLFFFTDSVLLFASKELEGYGGFDLFITQYGRGKWSTPKNLGATINTPSDELAPFLAEDGLTLYFSSNHINSSIGGFDIFKTQYKLQEEAWQKPQNLGLVINSAQDDSNFRLSASGLQAFFSSNRYNGQGGQDIYIAYLNDTNLEMNPNEAIPFYAAAAYKQAQLSKQLDNQRKKKKGLSYRILLTSSERLDRSLVPANYPDLKIRPNETGQRFLYYVGLYRTFYSAQQLQRDLIKLGWKDAQIVPHVNGIRLKEMEIEAMKERYPDLEHFN